MRPIKWFNRSINKGLLSGLMLAIVSGINCAAVSTTLAWLPSSDTNITGYNIYYGPASHDYTNMVPVGNVSVATIQNLKPGTLYYFAATSHDAKGNESAFSNEASFADYDVKVGNGLQFNALPDSMTNDQVVFSLAPGAPANVTINPTTGLLSWNTSLANANTTSSATVIIDDLSNPSASTQTTIKLAVSDYLEAHAVTTPVQAGQQSCLPLTTVASDGTTNMTFTVKWPGNLLHSPLLWLNQLPNGCTLGGELVNQETNLLVHIWAKNGTIPAGTNQLGEIYFQAAPGQRSAFLNLPITHVLGEKNSGSAFFDTVGGQGEVVVVGAHPLLRGHFGANHQNTLTIYATPGNSYQLQANTQFGSAKGWQPVQNFQATSVTQTIPVNPTTPAVFYRLEQL